MEYTKPWLSYNEQADRLAERGLIFDRDELLSQLVNVGYYRLSGYWFIFKDVPSNGLERFVEGTTFAKVWDLYTFDRRLRLLVFDAIERLEVYLRTQLAYRLAEKCGPFGFLDSSTLPNLDQHSYDGFISRCHEAYGRSKTLFIDHFKAKYGDAHELPPYWTLVNIMDFGTAFTLFRGSPNCIKKDIANGLGLPPEVFESWLFTLNTARNICAHHDRLWNRRLGNKVKIPRGRKYPDWHRPFEVNNSSALTLLTILGYLLDRIAPQSAWHGRVVRLLLTRSDEDLSRMGFGDGWQECPMWKKWLAEVKEPVDG